MTAPQAHAAAPHHDHGAAPRHGSMRGYLIGFALSVVLTAVPFWAVMTGATPSLQVASAVIFGLAFVQIVVHVLYFLHLDTHSESGWTLMAFAFTLVLVGITIAGSIWIMYHLDVNMMPMGSHGSGVGM